jgi:hypothetical protein
MIPKPMQTPIRSIGFEVMLPSADVSLSYINTIHTIKLQANGNITSKPIEQYSAAGC